MTKSSAVDGPLLANASVTSVSRLRCYTATRIAFGGPGTDTTVVDVSSLPRRARVDHHDTTSPHALPTLAGTIIFALIVPSLALGQTTGRVNGRLSDAATGTAIEGAMVSLPGTPFGAVSGADGRYLILRVPPGQYTIRAAYLGRRPASREIEVQAGRETTVDLELSTVVLQEVVVDGVRAQGQAEALTRQMNADNIVSIVASDQMGRFPDASAPDAVQRLPGVALERDLGEGRYIQIRGGSPQNTQVTFNGEQVPSPEGDSRQIAPTRSRRTCWNQSK